LVSAFGCFEFIFNWGDFAYQQLGKNKKS